MDGKVRSLILVDSSVELGRLAFLQALRGSQSFEVLAQCSSDKFKYFYSSISIKISEDVDEGRGYLNGLEFLMSAYNIVFTYATDSLFAFQSLKCAKKLGKIFIVFFDDETIEPRSLTKSQRAIRKEILQGADYIICSNLRSNAILIANGYPAERVFQTKPYINLPQFEYNLKGREKFRRYIGIDPKALVCLVKGVHDENYLSSLAESIHLAVSTNPSLRKHLKIIWNDVDFDMVKNLVFKFKLNQWTMLLDQDSVPFARDLFSACDIYFNFPQADCRGLARNFVVYELALSGALIIGDEALEQSVGKLDGVYQVSINDPLSITRLISRSFTASAQECESRRLLRCSSRKLLLQSSQAIDDFAQFVEQISSSFLSRSSHKDTLDYYKTALLDQFGSSEFVARALQEPGLYTPDGILLLFEIADRNVGHGFYDLGARIYEAIITRFSDNVTAYFGLGKISYLTHCDPEAMQFFKKALSFACNHTASLRMVAYVHHRQGLLEDAVDWLYKAYLSDTSQSSLILELCQMALKSDNHSKALKIMESVYRNTEGDRHASVIMALGHLYLRDGQHSLGQQMLEEAMNTLESGGEQVA